MENLRKELAAKGYPTTDEYCVIYAMFPQEVDKYMKAKSAPAKPVQESVTVSVPTASKPAAPAPVTATASATTPEKTPEGAKRLLLTIDGSTHMVLVEEL